MCSSDLLNTPFNTHIRGGSNPIRDYLPSLSQRQITSLRKKRIMFLDQITLVDGSFLLPWNELKQKLSQFNPEIIKSFKGPIPQWFKHLESTQIFSNYNRRLYSPLSFPSISYLPNISLKAGPINTFTKEKNKWIYLWMPSINEALIGKVIEHYTYSADSTVVYLEHWITYALPTESHLTPRKQMPLLTKCNGCSLHSPYYRDL